MISLNGTVDGGMGSARALTQVLGDRPCMGWAALGLRARIPSALEGPEVSDAWCARRQPRPWHGLWALVEDWRLRVRPSARSREWRSRRAAWVRAAQKVSSSSAAAAWPPSPQCPGPLGIHFVVSSAQRSVARRRECRAGLRAANTIVTLRGRNAGVTVPVLDAGVRECCSGGGAWEPHRCGTCTCCCSCECGTSARRPALGAHSLSLVTLSA